MSISNPKPAQISGGTWSLEAGINRFTVNIPTEPVDNDLAGVIIIAKAGSSPSYPADVVYKGPWSDFILIDTDASNSALLPNTSYTVGIAAYDSFGSDVADVNFGGTEKSVTTLQVVSADVADNAVTEAKISTDAVTSSKISTDAVTSSKISSNAVTSSKISSNAVTEAKISTNAVTNSKISTNAVTDSKIFDVSGDKLDGGTITSANGDIQIDLDNNKTIIGPTATQHIEQDGTTGALKFYANDGDNYVLAIQLDSGTSQAGDPTISTFGTTSLDKTAAEFLGDSSRPTVYMQNYGSGVALKLSGGASIWGGLSVNGVASLSGGLSLNGVASLSGGLSVNGDLSATFGEASFSNNSSLPTMTITNSGTGDALKVDGVLDLTDTTISGDVLSDGSGTPKLGESTNRWWAFCSNVDVNGYIQLDPNIFIRGYNNTHVLVQGGILNIKGKTPSSSSATGRTGDIAWDSNYFYVCVATNTWKRVALSTW
jgi:hypothetical protein